MIQRLILNLHYSKLGRWKLFFLFLTTIIIYFSILIPVFPIIKDFFKINPSLEENTSGYLFFALCIAPIWEELIFRLPLNFKSFSIIISLSLSTILFIALDEMIARVCLSFFMLFIFANTFFLKRKLNSKISIILSALLFALLHSDNFDYQNLALFALSIPILLSSQFLVGIFCGVLRKSHFLMAILFHSAYNASLAITDIILK